MGRLLTAAIVLHTSITAHAQEDSPPSNVGPPTHAGRDRAEGPVGQSGATFEVQGARLVLPPGLPIGNSRVLTFSRAPGRLRIAGIDARFVRIGPILSFNGALDATASPIEVSIPQPSPLRAPAAGLRLVLALEQPGLCTDDNRRDTLPGGLCSAWQLIDATSTNGRLSARLPTTGGLRIVFGWAGVPAE